MSTMSLEEKISLVKDILKSITRGADPRELKEKYGDVLRRVSPFEIAVIEQQLIREGISPKEILKVCDLHVEVFREYLESEELRGVPENHPVALLMRENAEIVKLAEALSLYANAVKGAGSPEEKMNNYELVRNILAELKDKVRRHYRKNQMLLFPYFERRGIEAVPRVLWGKEDEVITGIRRLLQEKPAEPEKLDEAAEKAAGLAAQVIDLVFRENKILYPAAWVLLSPGEWKAIDILARELGYIVDAPEPWGDGVEPVYPYMVEASVTPEQLEKLPAEMRSVLKDIEPDRYRIMRPGDIELSTGFLSPEEIELVFSSLPLEITFADENNRVRFFTKSRLTGGFPRAKTIVGRKLEYCHPPRLEGYVKFNVDLLKQGRFSHREFWTRMGGRIIRVLVVGVRDGEGRYRGTLEIVEDFTEVLENPEKIKEKIVVL